MDGELLGDGDSAIKVTVSLHPVLVNQNFHLTRELQEHVLALRGRGINNRSVKDILLGHLEDIIEKVSVFFVCVCVYSRVFVCIHIFVQKGVCIFTYALMMMKFLVVDFSTRSALNLE